MILHESLNAKLYELRDGRFQVDYINPLDRRRKRKIFTSKKEAKEYKDKMEVKYHRKDMSYFIDLPIGKLIEIHLQKCPKSGLTSRGKPFRDFYEEFSRCKLQDISTMRLRKWFEKIQKENDYSERTLIHIKIALTHFFRYLEEEEIIPSSPLKPIRFKYRVAPTRPRIYFSVDEVRTILENSKKWEKKGSYISYFPAFLYTLAHTGARRSEILNLQWKDVDYSLGTLTFRDTKVGDDRTIIMSAPLRAMIETLPRVSEYVFTNKKGERLTEGMVTRHQMEFRKKYPMKLKEDWGFHALRHSFAYNYLKAGGEMYQLQAILGHYRITSTINVYGRIKARDVERPSPYDF